jgi:hypothetical protein
MERASLVRAYVEFLIPMRQLADECGVEPQTIGKWLHEEGVVPKSHSKVKVECAYCCAPLEVPRYKARRIEHHYCPGAFGKECRKEHCAEPEYQANVQAMRKSREYVRAFFPLEDSHVVYDGVDSVLVFRNHADRRRWLATGEGTPLWRG